ncbi:MAG TPA: patatin-like phospholipase family protein, partial [Gemmata sp.]|nr:patatin-like phospholipase family protein [Gemmata sp.]
MRSVISRLLASCLLVNAVGFLLAGCQAARTAMNECPSPASQGLNVRDMIDKPTQDEVETLLNFDKLGAEAKQFRKEAIEEAKQNRNPNAPPWREKNMLCLSGGGSFGAFSAGVLCGWTAKGTRPNFDVVTGISTGALIAPFAFLGPAYDEQMKTFYTTLESKDLYKKMIIRGLFREALADNSKLAEKVDAVLTLQMMCELATEHQKGRRLYVGTTDAETKRFVIWDIGAIACKGRPQDRLLIKQILLGSSAIPGFFPPQHITVELDGECLTERHVDGGVSQALFMHAPYVPPEHRSKNSNHDLAGTNVYCIIAGKLYADPQPIKPMALVLAGQEISAMIYSQTRGDLLRIFTTTMLTGMNFYLTSIPTDYPAPTSSTAFEIPALVGMFNKGF